MLARSLRIVVALFTALISSTTLAQINPETGDVYVPPEEGGTSEPPAGGAVIDLQVHSTPEGAQVIVEREVIGVTPLDTQLPIPSPSVPVRVTLQHPGYQPYTFEIDATRSSHSLNAALAPIEAVAPSLNLVYEPRPPHELWAGLGFFTKDNDEPYAYTNLTLELAGRFRLIGADEERELALDLVAQWSLFLHWQNDTDPEARPGNPNVYVTLGSVFGALRVYAGAGLTLPIAAAINDGGYYIDLLTYSGRVTAAMMRGFVEPWNYMYSHMGFHARGGLEARFEQGYVGAEMALGVMAGIDANYRYVNNIFGWQLRLFGEARPIDLVSFGGQLGIVYLKDIDEHLEDEYVMSEVWVSLEPIVRFHFGPAFVGLRFLLNFTSTLLGGSSFDDGGVWALTVEGGLALE